MNPNAVLSLALLGWFVALAIAEAAAGRDSPRSAAPDDDARLVTNFGFTALIFLIGTILPLTNVAAAASAKGLRIGLANQVAISWLVILALTLVGQTFGAYWIHRLLHHSPLLWRIHRVHHADRAVDVSTSLRNHPLELLVTAPVSALVILAIGAPISVVAVSQTIIVAATIWEHAEISLPPRIDRALATVVITPRLHRLHHDPERATHDTNFGTIFTIWDRLFGTLRVMGGGGKVGLEDQVARPDYFIDQIRSPLLSA
jgi:sterol desaturase/sphingolipid hydroxylase (fatty acid hydroxylase superfamily)